MPGTENRAVLVQRELSVEGELEDEEKKNDNSHNSLPQSSSGRTWIIKTISSKDEESEGSSSECGEEVGKSEGATRSLAALNGQHKYDALEGTGDLHPEDVSCGSRRT